ncbi:MAG: hypothetical protein ACK47M_04585 [Caldilinea sp.]
MASIDENGCLLGEYKWTTRPIGADILEQLAEKSKTVQRLPPETPTHLTIFARIGFLLALYEQAHQENIPLADLSEIIA